MKSKMGRLLQGVLLAAVVCALGVSIAGAQLSGSETDATASGGDENTDTTATQTGTSIGDDAATAESSASAQPEVSDTPPADELTAIRKDVANLELHSERAVQNISAEIRRIDTGDEPATEVRECLVGILTREGGDAPGAEMVRSLVKTRSDALKTALNDGNSEEIERLRVELFGEKNDGGLRMVLSGLEQEASECESENNDPNDDLSYMEDKSAEQTRVTHVTQDTSVIGDRPGNNSVGAADDGATSPGNNQLPPPLSPN